MYAQIFESLFSKRRRDCIVDLRDYSFKNRAQMIKVTVTEVALHIIKLFNCAVKITKYLKCFPSLRSQLRGSTPAN